MYYFVRKLVELFVHLRYRVHRHGEVKKLPPGGCIIACNHQSYADPPVISAMFRAKYSFMAKSELFEKNKFFAWIIRKCGAFPVTRGAGDNSAIEKALADLKEGRAFVIFPEGTRSKDGTIGRGKSGVALIAGSAGVPVLPVCIMYGRRGKKRRLDFAAGELIPAEELVIPEGDRQALKRVSSRIMDSIKALQEGIISSEN